MTAFQASTAVDATWPQRKRTTEEHLKKRSEEEDVDCRIQVQMEEDGGGSRKQSCMENSGLLPLFHPEWQGFSQVNSKQYSTQREREDAYVAFKPLISCKFVTS